MTVNVEALINSLGKSYQYILDKDLIPYKSLPKGSSGTPTISLEMAQEGIFLSFWREGRVLKSVTLRIQHEPVSNWIFPNELPAPLQASMSRKWINEILGEPLRSAQPFTVMNRDYGWTDLYEVRDYDIPVSMQINYDVADSVRSITFMPTSELRW